MLSGFALAQPLLDILSKNPEFFAIRGSTSTQIVLFALFVVFVPPLALLAVELLVAVFSRPAASIATSSSSPGWWPSSCCTRSRTTRA